MKKDNNFNLLGAIKMVNFLNSNEESHRWKVLTLSRNKLLVWSKLLQNVPDIRIRK